MIINRLGLPNWLLALLLINLLIPLALANAQEIPAEVGAQLTAKVLTTDGGLVERQITLEGQSPDELFTYWIGFDGERFLGYDQFSGLWVPGPVTYHDGLLTFQGEIIEGWVRKFAGVPDYHRFFGDDGVLYERYNNYFDANNSYSYFVNTVTGERSDADEILGYLQQNPRWAAIAIEQQRVQAEEIRNRVERMGNGMAYWRNVAHTPPSVLPGTPVEGLDYRAPSFNLPPGTESLLDLIEGEIGPLDPQEPDSGEADD